MSEGSLGSRVRPDDPDPPRRRLEQLRASLPVGPGGLLDPYDAAGLAALEARLAADDWREIEAAVGVAGVAASALLNVQFRGLPLGPMRVSASVGPSHVATADLLPHGGTLAWSTPLPPVAAGGALAGEIAIADEEGHAWRGRFRVVHRGVRRVEIGTNLGIVESGGAALGVEEEVVSIARNESWVVAGGNGLDERLRLRVDEETRPRGGSHDAARDRVRRELGFGPHPEAYAPVRLAPDPLEAFRRVEPVLPVAGLPATSLLLTGDLHGRTHCVLVYPHVRASVGRALRSAGLPMRHPAHGVLGSNWVSREAVLVELTRGEARVRRLTDRLVTVEEEDGEERGLPRDDWLPLVRGRLRVFREGADDPQVPRRDGVRWDYRWDRESKVLWFQELLPDPRGAKQVLRHALAPWGLPLGALDSAAVVRGPTLRYADGWYVCGGPDDGSLLDGRPLRRAGAPYSLGIRSEVALERATWTVRPAQDLAGKWSMLEKAGWGELSSAQQALLAHLR